MICPRNGTVVLKGLSRYITTHSSNYKLVWARRSVSLTRWLYVFNPELSRFVFPRGSSFSPWRYVRVAGTRNERLLALYSIFSLRHPRGFKSTTISQANHARSIYRVAGTAFVGSSSPPSPPPPYYGPETQESQLPLFHTALARTGTYCHHPPASNKQGSHRPLPKQAPAMAKTLLIGIVFLATGGGFKVFKEYIYHQSDEIRIKTTNKKTAGGEILACPLLLL